MNHQVAQQVATLVNTAANLRLQGQYEQALGMFNHALSLDPMNAIAYFNRGMLFYSMQQYQAMQQDFSRTLSILPDNAEVFQKMAIPYVHLGEFEKAQNLLKQAVTLKPKMAEAWLWLVRAYYQSGDDEQAYATLQTATKNCQRDPALKLSKALYHSRVPASREVITQERERILKNIELLTAQKMKLEKPERELHFMHSTLSYHGLDNKELYSKLAQYMLRAHPLLGMVAPHCNSRKPRKAGPIRIGFVSENADQVTTMQFVKELMCGLKQDTDFEVYLITSVNAAQLSDAQGQEMAHHVLRISDYDLKQSRQVVADAELDILVYLEVGNQHLSYLMAFARLAPIQCVWGGLPDTSGIPNMDYFISTQGAEPENPERFYTETLLLFSRSPGIFKQMLPEGECKPKEAYGLIGGDARNYVCPVMLHKMHPDMDDIFASILAHDDKAHIILFRSPQIYFQKNTEARLQRTMPAEHYARVHFVPFQPRNDFLHLLTLADAVLDTLHYSFGTTAYLAFSVGVPFITCRGQFLRGRAGAYLYDQMEIPDCVVESKEDYVACALEIAQDTAKRDALKALINERSARIFDDVDIGREVAERFKELFHQKQAKAA